jgi:hypothetical protein
MARYLVEIAGSELERADSAAVAQRIADYGANWTHSYLGERGATSFCVVEGPDPETVRRAAQKGGWDVLRLTRVTILDPHR